MIGFILLIVLAIADITAFLGIKYSKEDIIKVSRYIVLCIIIITQCIFLYLCFFINKLRYERL